MLREVKNIIKLIGEGDAMIRTVGYSWDVRIVTPNIPPNYVFEDVDS